MSRNRVEELESKVAQLESTVAGLTEELVEAKDRIRDLEAELEPEPSDGSQFAGGGDRPEERPEPEGRSRRCHDEAAAPESGGGEGDKDEAPQSEDEAADSEPGDDIIIA